MSNETVSTWPRIEAVAREDGTGEVVVDGTSYPIAEPSLDQARVAIIGRVTETAEQLGRPVRVATNGPDGYWPLVVHPNGHVAADDNPPTHPASADGNLPTEIGNASGATEHDPADDGGVNGDSTETGDGTVAPGVPTLPARESYNGSPVPQSPRTALRHPPRSGDGSDADGTETNESAAAPSRDGDNTSRWDQDREDDALIGELLAGDPPQPDSAVEVTASRRLDWKSVWEPSDRWNVRRTKKEELPKLRFHESVSMPAAEIPADQTAANQAPANQVTADARSSAAAEGATIEAQQQSDPTPDVPTSSDSAETSPSTSRDGADEPSAGAFPAEQSSVGNSTANTSPADDAGDGPGSDQAGSDQAGSDQAGSDQAGSDQAGSDQAGSDQAGSDQAGSDQVAPDQTAPGQSAPGRSATPYQGYTGAESSNGFGSVTTQSSGGGPTDETPGRQPSPQTGRFTFGRQDPALLDPSGPDAASAGAHQDTRRVDASRSAPGRFSPVPGQAAANADQPHAGGPNAAQSDPEYSSTGQANTPQANSGWQNAAQVAGGLGQAATNGSSPAPVSGYAPGQPQVPSEPQPVAPEAQPLVPEAPQQRQSFLVQESAEEPASRGFRGLLTRAGIKVAPNELERSERNDMMAVSQHWPGPRTIAIVNGKGGAGKTPTTIMLSAVFALFGGAGVAAWDNNQTRGTLGWRTEQGAHDATLLDLLPEVPRLLSTGAQAADLAHFVHHQTRDRFDVLRSQPMVLAHEQRIEPRDVDAIHSVLGKYYRLIFIDSGNDESDPMWLRMIDHADQLVVATTTRNDHAEAGALLLEALASRDERSARLAQQSVAVITQADSNSTGNDVRRVTGGYQSLTRSTVPIPFDPGMVDGQLLFAQLKPETQRAWLAAAAAVATGL